MTGYHELQPPGEDKSDRDVQVHMELPSPISEPQTCPGTEISKENMCAVCSVDANYS